MGKKAINFILAALAGTVTVLALTIAIFCASRLTGVSLSKKVAKSGLF